MIEGDYKKSISQNSGWEKLQWKENSINERSCLIRFMLFSEYAYCIADYASMNLRQS